MAQFIQCDRCHKSTPGRIKEAQQPMQGLSGSLGYTPGGPTVSGWTEVRGKLLCPSCDNQLDKFLDPLPREATT